MQSRLVSVVLGLHGTFAPIKTTNVVLGFCVVLEELYKLRLSALESAVTVKKSHPKGPILRQVEGTK